MVQKAGGGELVAVCAVQNAQVRGLGVGGDGHGRPRPGRGPGSGLVPGRVGIYTRLPQVVESGGERPREVRALGDGAEVPQVRAPRRDDPPREPLPGERIQDDRRRTAVRGRQVGGQAPECGHLEVGDGPEPTYQEVPYTTAHRGRPDHDGDTRERAAALELLNALPQCVIELPKAAADKYPLVCIGPGRHGRGERTTEPGRVR